MGGRSRLDVSAFVMDYTNLQVQTPIGIGVFDIRNAAAATIRGVEVENTSRLGRGVEAGGHVTWLDATYDQYIAVSNSGVTGDVAGNRLNNAPEWAGRFWIEWTGDIGRSRTAVDRSRRDGAVDCVLHAVQRRHPTTEPVWAAGRPRRIRTPPSSMGCRCVRAKPHEHGLHHGDLRDAAHGIWRTSRTLASVCDRFHRTAITAASTRRVFITSSAA